MTGAHEARGSDDPQLRLANASTSVLLDGSAEAVRLAGDSDASDEPLAVDEFSGVMVGTARNTTALVDAVAFADA